MESDVFEKKIQSFFPFIKMYIKFVYINNYSEKVIKVI